MKKILFSAAVLLMISMPVKSQSEFAPLSLKAQKFVAVENVGGQVKNERDPELAATIKRLTNKSTEGLKEKKIRGGGFLMNLQERFQNVMLAKIDADNEPAAACVTSVEEANEFFGRNLETGEPQFSTRFEKENKAAITSQYGMTDQEYDFYKNLIEDAAIRRAQSPNSATITIVNADGAGEGFNDTTASAPEGGNGGTTVGQQRLNLFNYAASIWGAYLDTSVAIKVSSQFDPLTCTSTSATLGSAGPSYSAYNFPNAPFTNTNYPAALATKIYGSAFSGAPAYEINATFNSTLNNNAGCLGGRRFYYGFDNSTPSGTVNLLVVLLHEMGHGLGFVSFVDGYTGAFSGGRPDIFSRFMYDSSTAKYWYQMTDAERQASALNNGNVWWDGANVKIASSYLTGGRDSAGRVQMFTPTTLQPGSSVSHWDTSATANLLMEPVINFGLSTNLDLTRQQMRDIGWFRDSNGDAATDTVTGVQLSVGFVYVGSQKTVTWTNNGGFNRNVTVELSTNGGVTYPTTLGADVVNTGAYTFTVPNSITSQARIRVRESGFSAPQGVSASNFNIQYAPTAAGIVVAGKVTDSKGRGIDRAKITVTKDDGSVITALTNLRGYYRVDGIEAGQTSLIHVSQKPFIFESRVVTLNEDLLNLNFSANSPLRKY